MQKPVHKGNMRKGIMGNKMEMIVKMKKSRAVFVIPAILFFVVMPYMAACAQPGEPGQFIVSQSGMGDFTTIQEAVDHAADGDTLIIYPGIYNEEVRVMNKELNITGISREMCILRYDSAYYRKVPLTIAAGTVSNLTIYGMDSGVVQPEPTAEEIARMNEELVGDSWERQKNYKGYAVHIDQNLLYQKSIRFANCRILSENSHCVGIGSRGGCTINFENCEFVSMGEGGCMYLHDAPDAGMSGETKLIMTGCQLTSYISPYVMTFQSLLPEYNTLSLTFQNVRVSAVAYAESDGYVPLNVNTFLDVETLLALEKTGFLYGTGFSSTAPELVHELTDDEAADYISKFEAARDSKNVLQIMAIPLPEGITYLAGSHEKASIGISPFRAKHQVIAIYNRDNLPGNGWCGLSNAYLTADSYGNTLVEMNTVSTVQPQNTLFNPGTLADAAAVSGTVH